MSEAEDKAVHLLNSLGLAISQAKVYFTLAKSEKSTIKALLRASRVDRSDLYGILVELHKIRLVEKLATNPTEFRAIPMEEAISALIQLRNRKTIELQQQTIALLQQSKKNREADRKTDDFEFTIIKDPQGRLFKGEMAVQKTQESIKVVTKWTFFVSFTLYSAKQIMRALSRGVKIQVITQKPELQEQLPQHVQAFMKNPFFQIKYVSFLPSAILALFDNKKVTIAISTTKELGETPFSWSNNHGLIEIAQSYFENMWNAN